MKYGVISMEHLMEDLVDWTWLYTAGRCLFALSLYAIIMFRDLPSCGLAPRFAYRLVFVTPSPPFFLPRSTQAVMVTCFEVQGLFFQNAAEPHTSMEQGCCSLAWLLLKFYTHAFGVGHVRRCV